MNDSLRISTAKISMNFLFFIICQVGLGQLVAVVVDTEGELVATAEPVNDEIEQILWQGSKFLKWLPHTVWQDSDFLIGLPQPLFS